MRRHLLALSLLLGGCAAPHRAAVTTHEIWIYSAATGRLVYKEKWRDKDGGGGQFLLTDPNVAQLNVTHTNQGALGGGSAFSGGPLSITVSPQAPAIIGAAGTAAGNIIGAALKTAVKP